MAVSQGGAGPSRANGGGGWRWRAGGHASIRPARCRRGADGGSRVRPDNRTSWPSAAAIGGHALKREKRQRTRCGRCIGTAEGVFPSSSCFLVLASLHSFPPSPLQWLPGNRPKLRPGQSHQHTTLTPFNSVPIAASSYFPPPPWPLV